jgi:hypothetical protein
MSLQYTPQETLVQLVEEQAVFIAPDDISPSKLIDSEQISWPMEITKKPITAEIKLEDNVFDAYDMPSFESTDSCTDDTDSIRNFGWSDEEENVSRFIPSKIRSSLKLQDYKHAISLCDIASWKRYTQTTITSIQCLVRCR